MISTETFFALSLGDSPHEYTDLFYDPALPANDLDHVSVSYAYFIYGLAAVNALGHRDLFGFFNEALYDIGQKFFHAGSFSLLGLDFSKQAAYGFGRLSTVGYPVLCALEIDLDVLALCHGIVSAYLLDERPSRGQRESATTMR